MSFFSPLRFVTAVLLFISIVAITSALDISVPSASTSITKSNTAITFASTTFNSIEFVNGNLDDGTDLVEISTSPSGTIKLSQTTGLDSITGDALGGDTYVSFFGTTTEVNDALDGLVYTPLTGYVGFATITISITGSQTVSSSFIVAVNDDIDPAVARSTILSGVTEISSGIDPGHLAIYGPTAYALSTYDNLAGHGPLIGFGSLGGGRVIAMPDHQMLNLQTHGSNYDTANFHKNAITWLSHGNSNMDVKIIAYEGEAGQKTWLESQGYTNVVAATKSDLASVLASNSDADVFIGTFFYVYRRLILF